MSAYRCATRLSWCWLLLLALAGCKTTADQGPLYKLQAVDERAVAAPVAVSVTDKRPPKERKYLPGAITPVDYQQGVETLTLDNFDPQLAELLKQAFAQRLATLSPVPTWADVEITRFRVVVDRRDILAEAYVQQLSAEKSGSVVTFEDDTTEVTAGSIVGGITSALVAAVIAGNKLGEVENHRASWNHAEPSVTCEIALHVQLHWADDYREEFDLEAQSHSTSSAYGSVEDVLSELKWNVSPTVEQAITQVGDRLLARAKVSLRNNPALGDAETQRSPVSTAPRPNPPEEVGPELEGAEPLPPALNAK